MYRRVGLLLFAAGWGANHFATLLVVYRKELGFSPEALGLLFGAYALGLVPGLILSGRASDARGRRALVLPASGLAIVATIVLAFGSLGFGVLLAGRLLYGLTMGSIMSPGSVWIQELSPPELGPRRATLALSAGFGLGPLASGVIAELVPARPAPMVLPYVAHALVMVVALVLALPVTETAPRAPVGAQPEPRGLGHRELALLARLLPVAPWSFGFAAVTAAILPGILRAHVARPVIFSALLIVTTLLSGVLVQPLTSRIGRRADLVGLAIGAAGTFVAARSVADGSPILAFVAAILAGAGYGLVITTGLREVSECAEKRARGTAIGVYYILTYVGFALPFAHAAIARSFGDAQTFRLTAEAALVCLAARAVFAPRQR